MLNKFPKKINRLFLVIPIVISLGMLLSIVIESAHTETLTSNPLINSKSDDTSFTKSKIASSNNLYSGPFAILSGTYGIDDTAFFVGSGIPSDSKGEIEFIRPDGKIHHTIEFDGSKSAVNHYFTPVSSSNLKECSNCKFFGTWEISFKSIQGISYAPIRFEVTNSTH